MGIFTIIIMIIGAALFVFGVVLMKRNIRPILGFILLIVSLVIFIGFGMNHKEIERSVAKTYTRLFK